MMPVRLEVLLSPAEFANLRNRDLSQTVCVVFDILRATTSMVTALANGAEAIIPVATLLSLPRLVLEPDAASRFAHGSMVDVGPSPDEGRRAVFSAEELLGIGTLREGVLHPDKVIAPQGAP